MLRIRVLYMRYLNDYLILFDLAPDAVAAVHLDAEDSVNLIYWWMILGLVEIRFNYEEYYPTELTNN